MCVSLVGKNSMWLWIEFTWYQVFIETFCHRLYTIYVPLLLHRNRKKNHIRQSSLRSYCSNHFYFSFLRKKSERTCKCARVKSKSIELPVLSAVRMCLVHTNRRYITCGIHWILIWVHEWGSERASERACERMIYKIM